MQKGFNYIIIFLSVLFIACQSNEKESDAACHLVATEDFLEFSVPSDASMFIKSMQAFEGEDGKSYFSFLSNEVPEIYFYDIETKDRIKTIHLDTEGPDGIGRKAGGFYMVDWNRIYVPDAYLSQISVVDSTGHKLNALKFDALAPDYPFIPTNSLIASPLLGLEGKLYASQKPNPRLGGDARRGSTTEMIIRLDSCKAHPFAFHYPSFALTNYSPGQSSLGLAWRMSRCFNGSELVYSFGLDENVYVVSLDGNEVAKHQVESRFIKALENPKAPDDFMLGIQTLCENPFYGNIYYDKYRRLYYRVAYPQEDYDKEENFVDLWQFGRGKFSIIVLNEDFEVLGETLFPAFSYRSDLVLILEDGVYLSTSHFKREDYSDDVLRFQRMELVER